METDTNPVPAAASSSGGTVERNGPAPARARSRGEKPQRAAERYELRDPYAEVTYRADTLPDMVAKAEHLGISRFVAVAPDGARTPIQKVEAEWRRGPALPARSERPLDPGPALGDADSAATRNHTSGLPPPAEQERSSAKRPDKPADQAERAALVARIEATLMDRYIIKRAPVKVGDLTIGHTEYRFRGDSSRVAFTESTLRLATDTNSPSVARSMVDVAESRNWKSLRVSGHEDFRRMVWLEAAVRGIKSVGFEPTPADLDLLKRERETRLGNRIEHAPENSSSQTAATAEKGSGRGGGSRKAVLAAIEAILVAKNVPEKQRSAVMAAATEKLAQRVRDGRPPLVKVYDKAAPSQRMAPSLTPEVQRSRERAVPAPTR